MSRELPKNQELLTLVAFGASIILGLAGAPLWMALATGAVYGAEKLGTLLPRMLSGQSNGGDQALHQAGVFASRMGGILVGYGFAMALRILGNALA